MRQHCSQPWKGQSSTSDWIWRQPREAKAANSTPSLPPCRRQEHLRYHRTVPADPEECHSECSVYNPATSTPVVSMEREAALLGLSVHYIHTDLFVSPSPFWHTGNCYNWEIRTDRTPQMTLTQAATASPPKPSRLAETHMVQLTCTPRLALEGPQPIRSVEWKGSGAWGWRISELLDSRSGVVLGPEVGVLYHLVKHQESGEYCLGSGESFMLSLFPYLYNADDNICCLNL